MTLSLGSTPCAGVEIAGATSNTTDTAGDAPFSLSLDRGGWGYAFIANVAGAPVGVSSNAFNVEGFCGTAGLAVVGRNQPTVTKLADGRVLVAGGSNAGAAQASAEIYDPATRTFSSTGPMNVSRFDAQAVLLADGRVLIAGGTNGDDLSSAETFDPATEMFTLTQDAGHSVTFMTAARRSFQMTRLADGRVLLTGGSNSGAVALGSAELFDPSTGLFTATLSPMIAARELHTATLLSNGNVVLVGGADSSGNVGVIEEFSPSSSGDSFGFIGSMVQPRNSHSANRLASGNVLIAGGNAPTFGTAATTAAEVDVPFVGSAATGSLNAARMSAQSALLPDGRVLAAGGFINGVPLSTAEVYTPTSPTLGTFSVTGSLATPRGGGSAVALNDGTVLVVGSSAFDRTAEIFYPSGPISATAPAFLRVPASGGGVQSPGHRGGAGQRALVHRDERRQDRPGRRPRARSANSRPD